MAQVRDRTQNVGTTLDFSLRAWTSLPEVAEEIAEWELVERLDFLYEWALEEMRLDRLHKQAEAGQMTEDQIEKFRDLVIVVSENRPIIERLQERYNS